MPRLTKDEYKYVLWMRGDLSWKLRPHQDILEAAYSERGGRFFVGNCARRFGKSFWACIKAVECAVNCKNSLPRIKIATATVKNLEEFILPAFKVIMDDCPEEIWQGWSGGYLRGKKKFVFKNGAEIQLVGLDKDPDGGRGNYVDLYVIDEAGYVSRLEYLFSSVISPMMLGRDGACMIMLSTPSSTPAHPFQDFCQRAEEGGYFSKLTIMDNTYIDEDERKRIREEDCLTESDWLREYMCEHVVDETLAIVPEYTKSVCKAVKRPEYYEWLDRYVSMDLGVKVDLTAILYGYWDSITKTLIIEDESEMKGPEMTTLTLCEMIKAKEESLWPNMGKPRKRVADNDNPLLIQDMGALHNLYFQATGKDSLHAMVNEVRNLVKQGKILIHPRCKKLLGCLEYGIWNAQRKSFDRSTLYGHYDHLASLVYMVRNLDQFSNPIPDDYYSFGMEQPEYVRVRKKKKSKTLKAIKSIMGLNR